ncbi:hypothetical protein F2P81_016952 [Scophthalmus maximus]|uniref:Uncharacterized protein n=1 Tax=Scophthalmus maximus TaxID=52904 RepID=A0A6A4SGC2_SCOMX|nr:hypothetical protein F2P81_016952 [Scophthalmus maximus]
MYCTLLLENKLTFSAADLDLDESQEASRRQGPLPDLLPQTEHPSWASPHHRAPRGEAVQELEVRRVASQLRAIGDQLNATIFRRACWELAGFHSPVSTVFVVTRPYVNILLDDESQ